MTIYYSIILYDMQNILHAKKIKNQRVVTLDDPQNRANSPVLGSCCRLTLALSPARKRLVVLVLVENLVEFVRDDSRGSLSATLPRADASG